MADHGATTRMGRVRQSRVDLVRMDNPGDTAGIVRLFDQGEVEPASIVAILGKCQAELLKV